MNLKNNATGLFLLALVPGACAISLGEVRGAAWIGQPLDLRVPLQLDEEGGAESLCLEAEVIYGELQQAAGRVRVGLESRPKTSSATVRIQSLNPVNEPVVTLSLRAGCQAKTMRRYVLLADFSVTPERHIGALARAEQPMPAAVVPVAEGEGLKTSVPSEPSSAAKPSKRAAGPGPASRSDKATEFSVRRADKQQTRRPRLSLELLEPLELRFERIQPEFLARRMPTQLAQIPAEASSEGLDVARQGELLKKLEVDLLSMQSKLATSEQAMSQLRSRVVAAESERYANPLVYALSALLLGALLSVAYLLRRQAKEKSAASEVWYETVNEGDELSGQAVTDRTDVAEPSLASSKTSKLAGQEVSEIDVGNLFTESQLGMSEFPFEKIVPRTENTVVADPLAQADTKSLDVDTSRSLINSSRVQADPLHHAEFMVSLGQPDQAIKILSAAIEGDHKKNSEVYLDLLKIYHAMGKRDDYRHLSEKFSRLFKVHVPDYAKFRNEGRDLTAYDTALTQICFYWTSPEVIDVIDGFIYVDPKVPADEVFDLQAFRELLLLRAVALNKLDAPKDLGRTRSADNVRWQS